MANIQIAILNRSSIISDAQVQAPLAAFQKQISEDFAPMWGVDADLTFVGSHAAPLPGQWWLAVLDNSDQAGALGYHDLTDQGLPIGKVFAQTSLDYNEPWTLAASHELLEMLADPDINLSAMNQTGAASARLYAYEVCDACEAEDASYQIDSVVVSDFVYPTWFEQMWLDVPDKPQFDHSGVLQEPFQLHPGGYISIMDVSSQQGWTQIFGARGPSFASRARVGSRRERRRTPRAQWLRSCPSGGAQAASLPECSGGADRQAC